VETLLAGLYQLSRGQIVDLVGSGYLRLPASPQLCTTIMAGCSREG